VFQNIFTLFVQAKEQLLDAFIWKKVIEDLNDQFELLVKKIGCQKSPQVREVLGLSQEAKESHVELGIIGLVGWQ
jgi:hypothetical protein